MKKVTSTLLILGALIMFEVNTTTLAALITPGRHQMHLPNILLARLVHGGVYNRPDSRPDENRDEGRQNTDNHNQDQQNTGSHNNGNGQVNKDRNYDNGVGVHGGIPSYEHYHWTDGTGNAHY